MTSVTKSIEKAIALRHKLWTVTNAVRLVNGAGDGLPGLLIDRYHCHVISNPCRSRTQVN